MGPGVWQEHTMQKCASIEKHSVDRYLMIWKILFSKLLGEKFTCLHNNKDFSLGGKIAVISPLFFILSYTL